MPTTFGRPMVAASLAFAFLTACSSGGARIDSEASAASAPTGQSQDDPATDTAVDTADATAKAGETAAVQGKPPSDGDDPGGANAAMVGGPGSGEAQAFKDLAPVTTEFAPSVQAFVGAASGQRLDELAADTCHQVDTLMTSRQLGRASFDAYERLASTEQAVMTRSDWMALFGAMLGYFCPENLPRVALDPDAAGSGSEIDRYREVVSGAEVSGETQLFVDTLADGRVDQLQGRVCANTTAETTSEEFGQAIVDSYAADLSDVERGRLTINGFSELYGGMVGWFCPGNLPL